MPAVLALLGGDVDAVSASGGRRTIAAADLVVGAMESSVRADELVVSARFPHPPPRSGSSWQEVSRRQGDYAVVGVGAMVTLADDDTIASARLALVSVGVKPVCVDATPPLAGRRIGDLDRVEVAELLAAAIDPEPDIHASADYRAHLAQVLCCRALAEAAADAHERSAA
jgi:carbon-monoxide dehydrogenase medium subunit